ncbi:hypothetical protein BDK51DRAFT_46803, partial [Blyttiomyces helicus]
MDWTGDSQLFNDRPEPPSDLAAPFSSSQTDRPFRASAFPADVREPADAADVGMNLDAAEPGLSPDAAAARKLPDPLPSFPFPTVSLQSAPTRLPAHTGSAPSSSHPRHTRNPQAAASLPGRKHTKPNCTINEDGHGTFVFEIPSSNSDDECELACGFFLADGHGEALQLTPGAPPASSTLPLKSNAMQFMAHLQNLLPKVVERLVLEAFEEWVGAPEAEEPQEEAPQNAYDVWDFASTIPPVTPAPSVDPETALKDAVVEKLERLHEVLDAALGDEVEGGGPQLCGNNGSTLCLALVLKSFIVFCNVGDSSMMLFDKTTGKPLEVWQRSNGLDLTPAILLHMINSLGNFYHKSGLLSRTTVYCFDVDRLLGMTDGSLVVCFVSDGVKDVLKARQIGSSLVSIESLLKSFVNPELAATPLPIETLLTLASATEVADSHDKRAKAELLECMMSAEETSTPTLQTVCDALVNTAILRRSSDDVTALLVEISAFGGEEPDVQPKRAVRVGPRREETNSPADGDTDMLLFSGEFAPGNDRGASSGTFSGLRKGGGGGRDSESDGKGVASSQPGSDPGAHDVNHTSAGLALSQPEFDPATSGAPNVNHTSVGLALSQPESDSATSGAPDANRTSIGLALSQPEFNTAGGSLLHDTSVGLDNSMDVDGVNAEPKLKTGSAPSHDDGEGPIDTIRLDSDPTSTTPQYEDVDISTAHEGEREDASTGLALSQPECNTAGGSLLHVGLADSMDVDSRTALQTGAAPSHDDGEGPIDTTRLDSGPTPTTPQNEDGEVRSAGEGKRGDASDGANEEQVNGTNADADAKTQTDAALSPDRGDDVSRFDSDPMSHSDDIEMSSAGDGEREGASDGANEKQVDGTNADADATGAALSLDRGSLASRFDYDPLPTVSDGDDVGMSSAGDGQREDAAYEAVEDSQIDGGDVDVHAKIRTDAILSPDDGRLNPDPIPPASQGEEVVMSSAGEGQREDSPCEAKDEPESVGFMGGGAIELDTQATDSDPADAPASLRPPLRVSTFTVQAGLESAYTPTLATFVETLDLGGGLVTYEEVSGGDGDESAYVGAETILSSPQEQYPEALTSIDTSNPGLSLILPAASDPHVDSNADSENAQPSSTDKDSEAQLEVGTDDADLNVDSNVDSADTQASSTTQDSESQFEVGNDVADPNLDSNADSADNQASSTTQDSESQFEVGSDVADPNSDSNADSADTQASSTTHQSETQIEARNDVADPDASLHVSAACCPLMSRADSAAMETSSTSQDSETQLEAGADNGSTLPFLAQTESLELSYDHGGISASSFGFGFGVAVGPDVGGGPIMARSGSRSSVGFDFAIPTEDDGAVSESGAAGSPCVDGASELGPRDVDAMVSGGSGADGAASCSDTTMAGVGANVGVGALLARSSSAGFDFAIPAEDDGVGPGAASEFGAGVGAASLGLNGASDLGLCDANANYPRARDPVVNEPGEDGVASSPGAEVDASSPGESIGDIPLDDEGCARDRHSGSTCSPGESVGDISPVDEGCARNRNSGSTSSDATNPEHIRLTLDESLDESQESPSPDHLSESPANLATWESSTSSAESSASSPSSSSQNGLSDDHDVASHGPDHTYS